MKWFRRKEAPVNEDTTDDEVDVPRMWPDNEANEARKLYDILHNTIQRLCTLSNEQAGLSANGVSSVIAGYTVLVDERSYMDGNYVGGDVFVLSPPEQPSYITDAYLTRIVERRIGVDFSEDDDD